MESRATKTGNLISISTAHRLVGNAVVFHSHAASLLMFVLRYISNSVSSLPDECSCFVLKCNGNSPRFFL